MDTSPNRTALGIVEGFYGRPYEDAHRRYLIDRAAAMGYSFYIYAPKNDPLLRRAWRDSPSTDDARRLRDLKAFCDTRGVELSFGLSPLGIDYDEPSDRTRVLSKLDELTALTRPSFVCVFFDDIRADAATLGACQAELVAAIREHIPDEIRIVCCPTFYSFDPILERIFGKRPEEYFADLKKILPEDTIMCWTGNQVLSPSVTADDLRRAAELLERPICLWDNYPVNDGRNLADRIFLNPFRDRAGLEGHALMHAVNPMTEAALSTVPLSSLPLIYKGSPEDMIGEARERELSRLFGEDAAALKPLLEICCHEGRAGLKEEELKTMLELCGKKGNTPGTVELRDFLLGRYAFDPQCLTS